MTQFNDLLEWSKGFRDGLQNHRADVRPLQNRLLSFEQKLMKVRNHSLTNEEVAKLYNEADELYIQFNSDVDLFERNTINVKKNNYGKQRVGIGKHQLPPLPYAYNALQPYIDEEIMRLHHTEHHKGYVEGLNKAEKEMEKARKKGDFDLIKHWEREAAFNGAGHYLHTIFWNVMSPKGGGKPKGALLEQIELDFGSFEGFQNHFSEAAKKVEAVGWAILVWSPRANRLEILQAEKHQNLSQWDVVPLLPLDVWEHAYYLQYKNKRDLYVDNWWNIVNWDYVNDRFEQAKQLQWKPF